LKGHVLETVGAIMVGVLGSRWLTNESDKRLLRLAILKASTTPAAHPDTVQAIEVAPPHVVLALAASLEPRLQAEDVDLAAGQWPQGNAET
jgi:hypothetical protein